MTDLMEKHPDALSPDHAVELERVRSAGVSSEQQAEADRRAEHARHPHTRLTALQKQLTDRHLDAPARIGNLHSVLAQLLQIIKEHTPAPNEPGGTDGEGTDGGGERQPAEGADQQVA